MIKFGKLQKFDNKQNTKDMRLLQTLNIIALPEG